jgi:hypothetical protein
MLQQVLPAALAPAGPANQNDTLKVYRLSKEA